MEVYSTVYIPAINSLMEDNEEVAECADEIEAVNSYLEDTWIGKKYSSGIVKRQRFQHELWNKHDAVLNDFDLTNNTSEQFNAKWNQVYFILERLSIFQIYL